ncbi:AAA family ATPase [Aquimarina algiphila]|uniref:ATPase AAA-type core domain-containing protein n=1 Tax=Aquimarina algiphila TaxID=2047982 RepID=A0A554VFC0_9FLAO|nr:ATP-binding protein [Aquimarina algiphila]TSE05869.1 hypothetical protein FOF46_21360 [Aquimarina algiphila]
MRLAAVFMEDQDLEKGGKTINFGGFYRYDIIVKDGKTKIKSEETKNFIEDFFDDEGFITNISAIVGTNGCGKTTLIYDLIATLQGKGSGFTIWEDKEAKVYLKNYSFNLPIYLNGINSIDKYTINTDTIYYSPYLDNKKPAFGIDISADRYLAEDLAYMGNMLVGGNDIDVSDQLKRKNQERFIKFQKSKYADGIRERYGLLSDKFFRVNFTNHKIRTIINSTTVSNIFEIEFNNTPENFRPFLNELYNLIKKEYQDFDRYVNSEEDRYELNKRQMKNLILEGAFCLLINLMEVNNTYLEEGFFKNDNKLNVLSETSDLDAYQKLQYWLKNYYYSKGTGKNLPDQEILNLLSFLFNYIDGPELSMDLSVIGWDTKSLYFQEGSLNRLLRLNQDLLNALPKYYRQEKDSGLYIDLSRLQQFVNFEFSNRSLSSGETAMLNLFSRIFDFFDRKILNTPVIPKAEYYLLFLDEADLGYHPKWKITYISSIIQFCKSFFKELEAKVQVIISTHDPLSLSDIPNYNITYLHKSDNEERTILSFTDPKRPSLSFGANITDLLEDSFFLAEHPIGNFAKNKINKIINWINWHKDNKRNYKEQELENIKQIISLIEEPVLRNKLVEMISEIEVDDDFIEEMIKKETSYLRNLLKKNS